MTFMRWNVYNKCQESDDCLSIQDQWYSVFRRDLVYGFNIPAADNDQWINRKNKNKPK
jgi:hypothetical protein